MIAAQIHIILSILVILLCDIFFSLQMILKHKGFPQLCS
jgi:hypothetical protein